MKSLAIVGGAGRMGQAMAQGLGELAEISIVALVDPNEPARLWGATHVTSLHELDPLTLDVVVEFSNPDSVVVSAQWCAVNGVALVIGATGLSKEQRDAVETAATQVGIVMSSNFSIGAVLAERFAAMAAPYFDRAEIIEMHHDHKVDAPSGTSLATAHTIAMARARSGRELLKDMTTRYTLPDARGAEAVGGVRIHSVRLPGLMAHQEILFGAPGEGLTIRHDSFDRQSFVHGVALAVSEIDAAPRFIDGIDSLVG